MNVKFHLEDLRKELNKGLKLVKVDIEYVESMRRIDAKIIPPKTLQLVIKERYHPKSLPLAAESEDIEAHLPTLTTWIESVKDHAEGVEKQCVNLIKALRKLALEEVKT